MIVEKTWPIRQHQPTFSGHFPGKPILPGVLIIAHLKATLSEHLDKPLRLSFVKRQKFIAPVEPDLDLTISINQIAQDNDEIHVSYQATANQQRVAKGSIVFVEDVETAT